MRSCRSECTIPKKKQGKNKSETTRIDMKIVNKRGREFLDICRINDLSIVNGRTIGDIFGSFTCHQKRGSSVVDYLLTSSHNLKNVLDFSVGEYQPLLSDHCPIQVNIQLKSVIKVDSQTAKLHFLPDTFTWDDNSSRIYTEHLRSEKIQNRELTIFLIN